MNVYTKLKTLAEIGFALIKLFDCMSRKEIEPSFHCFVLSFFIDVLK